MQFIHLLVLISQILLITQCEKIDDPTIQYGSSWVSDVAQELHYHFMVNWIPDLDKVAEAWFDMPANKRLDIQQCYDSSYKEETHDVGYPLSKALLFYSTGSLDELYKSSLALPESILARTIHNTIEGKLKEMGAIEEAVCANDKQMKDAIAKVYNEEFKAPIEDQLAKFREDDKEYTHVMTTYCWKGLCQDEKISPQNVDKEAKALRDINPESDKEGFKKKLIEFLDKYCEPDLRKIFRKYRQGIDGVNDSVDKAFDVDRQRRAYNVLVRYIEYTCQYYADQLKTAFEGCGADIRRINRVVLTRCERDLGCILKKYKEIYGVDFLERLKSETPTEPRYRKSIGILCGQT